MGERQSADVSKGRPAASSDPARSPWPPPRRPIECFRCSSRSRRCSGAASARSRGGSAAAAVRPRLGGSHCSAPAGAWSGPGRPTQSPGARAERGGTERRVLDLDPDQGNVAGELGDKVAGQHRGGERVRGGIEPGSFLPVEPADGPRGVNQVASACLAVPLVPAWVSGSARPPRGARAESPMLVQFRLDPRVPCALGSHPGGCSCGTRTGVTRGMGGGRRKSRRGPQKQIPINLSI